MKIDRLISILSILLQKGKVIAPYPANKLEVSRRTINRGIEGICMVDIPIVTTRGVEGGISIMEGFRIDKTLLTSWEIQSILAGPCSLNSVSGTGRYKQLMDKLVIGNQDLINMGNHIVINLSPWYKESLTPKIKLVQDAIKSSCLIHFSCYSPSGETGRTIEPYTLISQRASWYVQGYCCLRQDYRMFKLNRMVDLELRGEHFRRRGVSAYENEPSGPFPTRFQVKAICQPRIRWRVVEEFGVENPTEMEDDRLLFRVGCSDKENLLSWILSLGSQVELLESAELREDLLQIANMLCKQYEQT